MQPTINLLKLENYPILQQLQLEEALLRADQNNWCIINDGTPPAIVMGISGKPELLINSKKIKTEPVPLIRRFSGGGTVFVDESTCFVTFICNVDLVQVQSCPEKVLKWSADIYRKAFHEINFELRENDYAIGDRKFGGNAQYFCKGRWLHHSSLLWDFKTERMEYLLHPPKVPKYRLERSHNEFLVRLKDFYACREECKRKIVEALGNSFKIQEYLLNDLSEVFERPHRKATKVEQIGN